MDVKEAIFNRRSIRSFNAERVSDPIVRELLECAMAAPSACNRRPWEFYVIRDKGLQEKLRLVTRFTNMNSSLMIVVAGNDRRSLTHMANDFWIQDCAAATENLLLAATSLGIASCWCGLFPMPASVKKVKEILGLEDHVIPMALVHLGYSDQAAEARTQYEDDRVHVYGEEDRPVQ